MSDASEHAAGERASSETPAPEPPASEGASPSETEETLALPPTTADREPTAPSPIEETSAPRGVPVPFAAPPAERDRGRFATKLVLSLVGGFLVVAAIIVGLVVSLVIFSNSLYDRIEEAAASFMEDVEAQRWDDAHQQLCPRLRTDPVDSYVGEWESWNAEGAEVVSLRETSSGAQVLVELDDGSTVELELIIDQSGTSIEPSVCGWDHDS